MPCIIDNLTNSPSAHERPDVVRKVEFSSHRKTEDVDTDTKEGIKSLKRKRDTSQDMDELLAMAVKGTSEHRGQSSENDKRRLAIDEERFALEQRKADEQTRRDEARLQIERERNAREAEEAKQKGLSSRLEQYKMLRDSVDPLERALARKLAQEIAEAHGLDIN